MLGDKLGDKDGLIEAEILGLLLGLIDGDTLGLMLGE